MARVTTAAPKETTDQMLDFEGDGSWDSVGICNGIKFGQILLILQKISKLLKQGVNKAL